MSADYCILQTKTVVFFGCGGHARSVAALFLKENPGSLLHFVDDQAKEEEKIFGFPVMPQCPEGATNAFLAIGDNQRRELFWTQYSSLFNLLTIISGSSEVSSFATVGKNVFVGNFAHVGPEVSIGDNTIINTAAIIEHEVKIGCHSHVGPNATISGRTQIGDRVFIGVGAVVKDSIRIGSDIVVGAGAVVVKDLLDPGVYIGCPAKLEFSQNSLPGWRH